MATRWTVKKKGIQGSRWEVWEKHFQDILPWDEFKDNAVKYNPHLNKSTGWCFVPEYTYTLPVASADVEKEPDQDKDVLEIEQLIRDVNVKAVLKSGSGAKESVQALQRLLNDLGFGEQLNWQMYGADGDYGSATALAVRSFAVKNGFASSGEMVTQAIAEQLLVCIDMLDDLRNIYNALNDGKIEAFYYYKSPHFVGIVSLQTLLKALGYGEELNWQKYGADGDYGKSTANALLSFAKNENLAGDGQRLTNEQAEKIIDKLQVFYGEGWAQDVELPEKKVNRLSIKEAMVKGKKRIYISDDAGNEARFAKFKRGVYCFGEQRVESFIKENKVALSQAGVTDSAINVMLAVSENEGNLDGINTWDNSFMTFGIFQWTLGKGKEPGELAALLRKVKNHDPKLFEIYYGRHGLDIVDTGPISGYLSLNGKKLSTPSLKEQLRTHEWAFYFWLSGQDRSVQAMEIQHALSRIDAFYRNENFKVKQYFISDLISSEYGVGLLLDNHVNRPGYLRGCLCTAFDKADLPDPGGWGDNEEYELIAHYLKIRETYGKYPMTDAAKRAQVTRKYLENGIISDKRGSFKQSIKNI